MNAFLLMRGVATYLHGYTVRYIPLHTDTSTRLGAKTNENNQDGRVRRGRRQHLLLVLDVVGRHEAKDKDEERRRDQARPHGVVQHHQPHGPDEEEASDNGDGQALHKGHTRCLLVGLVPRPADGRGGFLGLPRLGGDDVLGRDVGPLH